MRVYGDLQPTSLHCYTKGYEYRQAHSWHANSRTGQTGKELLRNCTNTGARFSKLRKIDLPKFLNFLVSLS